jgi:uncharacterized protein (TIGR01777 family)
MAGHIVISGISGLIGTALASRLMKDGAAVVGLSRNPAIAAKRWPGPPPRLVEWDLSRSGAWEEELSGAEAVVNLAGENIAARRWSSPRKERILSSRIDSVRQFAAAIKNAKPRPKVFIQASAVGFYGGCGDQILDESSPPGRGFLAGVVRQWEDEAADIPALGLRTVVLRLGLVLSRDGGLLAKLLPIFRHGLGGRLGDGSQWMSWIHISDLVELMVCSLNRPEFSGTFNAVSPHPATNRDFTAILAETLGSRARLPVPAVVLKFIWGEMAREAILSGQRVSSRLKNNAFVFEFPVLASALRDLTHSRPDPA